MMIYIILCFTLFGFLALGYGIMHQRKQISEMQAQCITVEKQAKQIAKDQSTLINADLVFSKQLNDINRQLISMENQLQSLENQRQNDGAYQHALRILEMGGDKEEIITNCHLSNAEAELLMNLNAYRSALNLG